MRFAVLCSGSGSNLQALLDAARKDELGAAKVAVVVCNVPGAPAIERARKADVPARVIDHTSYPTRTLFEEELVKALREHEVEWVALAGFMRLLTTTFLSAYRGRVINIHPSLLPKFPGTHAQRQALLAGESESGCTIHFVDEGTDTGPVIDRARVPVEPGDTEETLTQRILAAEHRLYPDVVRRIAAGKVLPHAH